MKTGDTLIAIYQALHARYGDLDWWPAETPYEVIVGAILTQNTAWGNVEKAIARFPSGAPTPEFVARVSLEELRDIIRPSGFFNQKSAYLKEVTRWYERYGYSVDIVRREATDKLRRELLAVRGVGPETADSILLYAFRLPTFVVDAYTVRLLSRLGIDAGIGYSAIKAYFEDNLPRDAELYNNFHAMIVINAKEHCTKKPRCAGCPLKEDCREGKDVKA